MTITGATHSLIFQSPTMVNMKSSYMIFLIEEGYRIGFAGLEKWSEVDVSRRTYGGAVLAGAALALAGAVLWPIAAWRSR